MITAVHTLVYADDPEAARAFFRDVLGWPHVDAGGPDPGWLIFGTGASELGVHPTMPEQGRGLHHEVSLVCDDIHKTVTDLTARGAEFTGPVADHGYGLVAMMRVPGAGEMQVYQPRHATAHDL